MTMAKHQKFIAVLTIAQIYFIIANAGFDFNIFLNSSDVRGDLSHFWRSTGFCPPLPHEDAATFDLSPDMKQNLAYIGAVPHNGISQVRVHWLFELVTVTSITTQGPVYNFTHLDDFIALMHENELHVGFELMGNPSNIYTDMENKTQLYWWKDLVAQTAKRYIAKYGTSYVRQWNFETWNEPDCHDFDKLPMTLQGFLNYYDACSEGLRSVDTYLTLGGPGDGCLPYLHGYKSSEYADALLNHTIRGQNYFTGETGVRIDFLSFHNKGSATGIKILEGEEATMKHVQSSFPELADKPYYNDEADPLVGWSKPELWRANAVYAGLVAKVEAQHQNIIKANSEPAIKNYALLSNDNGFLSWYPNQFTQRTLLARFQMNNTSPHYVTFVRKPVYIAMTMLSLLGDKQIHLDLSENTGQSLTNTSDFGAIATLHEPHLMKNTSDSWQVTLLMYGATDPDTPTDYGNLNLNWIIDPPSGTTSLKLMTYLLYNGWGNAYDVWANSFNKPDFPTLKQFSTIRLQEEASGTLQDVPVKQGKVIVPPHYQILDPAVVVMHLCAQPPSPPEKVTGVRFINVTAGQVMVVWSDTNINTKCILTYEVYCRPALHSGPFMRVNKQNITVTLFLYETDSLGEVEGFYRVRAVDYWNRPGEYSDTVLYV